MGDTGHDRGLVSRCCNFFLFHFLLIKKWRQISSTALLSSILPVTAVSSLGVADPAAARIYVTEWLRILTRSGR